VELGEGEEEEKKLIPAKLVKNLLSSLKTIQIAELVLMWSKKKPVEEEGEEERMRVE